MNIFEVPSLQIFLVIVNIVSLTFFGVDKLRSIKGGWRISDSRLLLIAFFGPFGAYAGICSSGIRFVRPNSFWS
jgi:uncharacterized membrane protein YsdA (DUF1294 family)